MPPRRTGRRRSRRGQRSAGREQHRAGAQVAQHVLSRDRSQVERDHVAVGGRRTEREPVGEVAALADGGPGGQRRRGCRRWRGPGRRPRTPSRRARRRRARTAMAKREVAGRPCRRPRPARSAGRLVVRVGLGHGQRAAGVVAVYTAADSGSPDARRSPRPGPGRARRRRWPRHDRLEVRPAGREARTQVVARRRGRRSRSSGVRSADDRRQQVRPTPSQTPSSVAGRVKPRASQAVADRVEVGVVGQPQGDHRAVRATG